MSLLPISSVLLTQGKQEKGCEIMKSKDKVSYFGRIAVICGGESAERAVSLQSGSLINQALINQGHDSVLLEIYDYPQEQILALKPDRAFLALHGPGGEDGVVQGLLECMKIPYTGSGVASSSLAMDKYRTKMLWLAAELPTPAFHLLTNGTSSDFSNVPMPCFVKPVFEGSSLGVSPVTCKKNLTPAIQIAEKYSQEILLESLIEGEEYTVGILNDQALPVIRLEAVDHAFYDYDAKYESEETRYHVPSGLNTKDENLLKELSVKAFKLIGCEGWGRVDIMRDRQGKFWLLEVNTIPGMTTHSLVPMAAKAAGYSFEELVIELLKTSDHRAKKWKQGCPSPNKAALLD